MRNPVSDSSAAAASAASPLPLLFGAAAAALPLPLLFGAKGARGGLSGWDGSACSSQSGMGLPCSSASRRAAFSCAMRWRLAPRPASASSRSAARFAASVEPSTPLVVWVTWKPVEVSMTLKETTPVALRTSFRMMKGAAAAAGFAGAAAAGSHWR